MTRPLLFSFLLGCVCGLIVGAVIYDLSAAAHASERLTCVDRPDQRAYMARLPSEAHSTEFCLHAFRFGSPSWVPELGHPLKPQQEK